MAGYVVEGFIEAFEGLIESLEAASGELAPRFREALDEWGAATSARAVKNLNRPRWLLSRSIADKTRSYRGDRVFWATVGFSSPRGAAGRSSDPRDPENYGRYHEWNRRPGAPTRFLRGAKAATRGELLQKIAKINEETFAKLFAEKRDRPSPRRKFAK